MAIDYTQIVQGDTFGLVKVSSKKAVHLRMIVGLDINTSGQCVVTLADGSALTSDLSYQEVFKSYNRKVIMTYQAQAGIKVESELREES